LKIGIEDNQLKANVLQAIGDVQQFRKETDAAIESYNEALKLFRQVGDKLGEANVLSELAKLTLISGDLASADQQIEEVAKVYKSINGIYSVGACYGNFSISLLSLGNKI
jgi:tetratricopeptide (TPR) repeat protein